jgi:TonB family protein
MTNEYLIKRFLPFSMGFLAAVFVTSLFQAFGSLGQTSNVPEVVTTSHGKPYTCKNKFRSSGTGYASGNDYGSGSEIGTGTSSTDNGSLRILHKPRPQYTDEARSNGTEGTVVLRVTFLASGRIGSVQPVKGLDDGLTDQAIAAARRLEFEPAIRNGTPVSVTKTVEYTFSIY